MLKWIQVNKKNTRNWVNGGGKCYACFMCIYICTKIRQIRPLMVGGDDS